MAKKQSTRPNLLGIQKQMLDAGRDTRAESFMKGAMGAFAVNMAETEKQEAMMEKHMEDLGGVANIVKLPMEQRGQVEEFLRTNRDEYNTLAEQYMKTKDPAIKDKMNAIKYKFQTLDTELSKFAASKAEYMSDYEEGNLMKGGSFAKDNSFYMGMYGDPKTQFSIGETGEMSFTVNGETKAFKDVGSHTLRNYEAEKNIDTLFGTAADLKVSGKAFDKNRITNNFVNGHKSISRNDLQAILQTDLTGDGDKPSFMDQWASGGLGDEFYNGVDKNNVTEEDVKALLKDKQRGLDLMGKYVGNISQGIYDDGELDETVALTRKAKQAQINASNRANRKGDDKGKDSDLGFQSKYGYQNDRQVRDDVYKINNPGAGDVINLGKEEFIWNDEEKGWEDENGVVIPPKTMYQRKELPRNMYKPGESSMTDLQKEESETLGFLDFQQSEGEFKELIRDKYNLEGFIIRDTKADGFMYMESPYAKIDIVDNRRIINNEKNPNYGKTVYQTRTNFDDNEQAVKASEDFNKWLTNTGIQTTQTRPT